MFMCFGRIAFLHGIIRIVTIRTSGNPEFVATLAVHLHQSRVSAMLWSILSWAYLEFVQSNFEFVTLTILYSMYDILFIIIHSKYFPISDWLKPHA